MKARKSTTDNKNEETPHQTSSSSNEETPHQTSSSSNEETPHQTSSSSIICYSDIPEDYENLTTLFAQTSIIDPTDENEDQRKAPVIPQVPLVTTTELLKTQPLKIKYSNIFADLNDRIENTNSKKPVVPNNQKKPVNHQPANQNHIQNQAIPSISNNSFKLQFGPYDYQNLGGLKTTAPISDCRNHDKNELPAKYVKR